MCKKVSLKVGFGILAERIPGDAWVLWPITSSQAMMISMNNEFNVSSCLDILTVSLSWDEWVDVETCRAGSVPPHNEAIICQFRANERPDALRTCGGSSILATD